MQSWAVGHYTNRASEWGKWEVRLKKDKPCIGHFSRAKGQKQQQSSFLQYFFTIDGIQEGIILKGISSHMLRSFFGLTCA